VALDAPRSFRRKCRLSYRFQSCPILKPSRPCLVQLVCVDIVTSNASLEQHKRASIFYSRRAHALSSIRFGESCSGILTIPGESYRMFRESVVNALFRSKKKSSANNEHTILFSGYRDKRAHRIDLDTPLSSTFFRQANAACLSIPLRRELRCHSSNASR